MATSQIQSLADLSKKSPEAVEQIWNQTTDLLKASDPDYKRYTQEQNEDSKNELLGKFNAKVLEAVKKKLNIADDVQVQEDVGSITTTSAGGYKDGKSDSNSYIYKPKFGTFKRFKCKKKEVKEDVDVDIYLDKYFTEYLKERK